MRSNHLVRWKSASLFVAALLLNAIAAGSEPSAADRLCVKFSDEGAEISEGTSRILFYQKKPKSLNGEHTRAGYVHPLYDLDGNVLTQDFPEDHLHHRGIFWAWTQLYVGKTRVGNPWWCRDFLADVERVECLEDHEDSAAVRATVYWTSPQWTDPNGQPKPIVREVTTIRAYRRQADTRAIDFEIQLLALEKDVSIGGSENAKGYGGFSPRIRLPDGIRFTADYGEVEPQRLSVEPSPSMEITAKFGTTDKLSGITMLAHPSLPDFPPRWILRSSGSMQNAVYPGRHAVPLSDENPLVLRYRFVLHRGKADPAAVAGWTADYASNDKLKVRSGNPVVVDQYDGPPADANSQAFHFVRLHRAGNGNLVAFYRLRPDEWIPEDANLEEYHTDDVGYRVSTDDGQTWGPRRYHSWGGMDGCTLPDGSLLLAHFRTFWVNEHECRTVFHRSCDGGITWRQDDDVRVRFPSDRVLTRRGRNECSMRFWCATILACDLDSRHLLASIHGAFQDRDHSHAVLIESTDGGHTWDFVSCIAGDTTPIHGGYFGTAMVRLEDESMLAVVQTEAANPRILVQCRSNDDGRTWTEPIVCPNIPGLDPATFRYTAPDGRPGSFSGAYQHPQLLQLDNGVLALNYGRPGVHVSLSSDGAGRNWDTKLTVVPHAAPYSYATIGASSHKQGMVSGGPNRLLLLHDVYRYAQNSTDTPRNTVFLREITVQKITVQKQ
ncbi:MAG: PmoA family protein [Fuerstiella sp.]|nr:PmoA family protein [Fuerstiella sp.]